MHHVVPELIVENYRAGCYRGEFSAVGMFLDLSGFSTMTDALMQHGQHGAEVLASLMHGVFNPLVQSIFDYGGKIVSFAGDGIMALYPIESDEESMAVRALASAWVIQGRLAEEPERQTVYGKFSFSAKIGIAVGAVSWGILRSEDEKQATYYFRGPAVDDSANAEHHANAGGIMLTERMNTLLTGMIHTRPFASLHQFIGFSADIPDATPTLFPPVDLNVSRIFMPEEVIVHDVRGEFRQVVNLFMRIPDLPDEKLQVFINSVFELRKKYGGLVTRLDYGDKGCNMLMLWGAPVAYENDIGRALNFILDLQSKVDFPVTAGVTYYIAHAGYLGSAMCEDYTCYGWGVNLASRFMMSAPAGAIWVDERIARRVPMRFDIEYLGSQRFKGFAAEQKVNLLLNRKREADIIYQGEIVGREAELGWLNELVEPLLNGRFAGVHLLIGDAGIGKGRLMHEFISSKTFGMNKALWAVCQSDQILRQSFNPLRGWLLRYFGISYDHSNPDRRTKFESKLHELIASIPDPELAHELERVTSILAALVDVHWADSLYEQLDAEGRYNNTFLALIALLKAESLRQPVILLLEDLHFTDDDTKNFLPRLKRSILAGSDIYPLAVFVTSRPHAQMMKSLGSGLIDSQMELSRLSSEYITRHVETMLGGGVSPRLVSLVEARSEGNPYFVEQIIRYLQEENLLEMSRDGWTYVARVRDSFLPGDIRAVLVARLDQLTREVKDVVHTASVLGREFEVRALVQMLRPDDDAHRHIVEAEQAAIWAPLNEMRYIFSHGLLRDAAYSMQMHARRQELHALAVEALESLYADSLKSHYAELAHHAEQASLRRKAQEYYTMAGRVSKDLYQNSQGVDYFTRALAFTPFEELNTRFDLMVERVELFNRMGDRVSQSKDLDSLEKLALQLDDKQCMAKVEMLRSAYHYFIGNYQDAIESAKHAETYSESMADTDLVLYTQVVWSVSLFRLGHLDEAMAHAKKTLERDKRVGNKKEVSRVLSAMGWIALEQDEPKAAEEYLLEALAIARSIRDAGLESRALNQLAMLEGSVNGNYALAREYYERCYNLAREVGDRYMETGSLANLGFAAGMLGDFESARSYHEHSLTIAYETGDINQEVFILVNLSAIAGIQNDGDTALKHAHRAKELAVKISERSGEAWAELYLGHAHLKLNDIESARTAYHNSIAIRKELNQPALSMEPIAGLVEAYMFEDDLDSASREAEKILSFVESGSSLDGTDEPLRIYYACYILLQKKRDSRSSQVLQNAMNLLESQVSNFKDDTARKRYIDNIPWRRAIRDAAQVLLN